MTHTTIRETSIRHAMWTRVNPAPRIFSAICSARARRGIGPLAAARLVGEREPAAGRKPVVEHAQGGGRVVPEHDHVHAEHAIERSGKVRIEHVTRTIDGAPTSVSARRPRSRHDYAPQPCRASPKNDRGR
jgi:hypothetical protein